MRALATAAILAATLALMGSSSGDGAILILLPGVESQADWATPGETAFHRLRSSTHAQLHLFRWTEEGESSVDRAAIALLSRAREWAPGGQPIYLLADDAGVEIAFRAIERGLGVERLILLSGDSGAERAPWPDPFRKPGIALRVADLDQALLHAPFRQAPAAPGALKPPARVTGLHRTDTAR